MEGFKRIQLGRVIYIIGNPFYLDINGGYIFNYAGWGKRRRLSQLVAIDRRE